MHRCRAALILGPAPQDRVPEFLKVPVVMSIHKGIRYHKKNVKKMEEKEGNTKKGQ